MTRAPGTHAAALAYGPVAGSCRRDVTSPGRDVSAGELTDPGPRQRQRRMAILLGLDFWAGVSSAYSFFGALFALGLGPPPPSFPLPARGSGPQLSRSHALSNMNAVQQQPLFRWRELYILNVLAFAIPIRRRECEGR